jgi:hypothetical protein
MASAFKHFLAITAGVVGCVAMAAIHSVAVRAEESHYHLVENWAQFPPGVTKWGAATGVDVDPDDNVYVLHRSESMPIMVFDRHGNSSGRGARAGLRRRTFCVSILPGMSGLPTAETWRRSNSPLMESC